MQTRKKPKHTRAKRLTQKQIDALVNRCITFANRHGTILFREGTPVTARLSMKYKRNDLQITFSIVSSAMANGASRVEVYWRKKKVFAANGRFLTSAYNCNVTTHLPGAWEKRIVV